MKKFFALLISITTCLSFAFAQSEAYDETLAESLGADEYGMKKYVMVTLLTGNVKELEQSKRDEAFRGHFSNMASMAEAGQLVLAGPFLDSLPKRGLFIFNTDDLSTAEQWVKNDPAVEAGIFTYEMSLIYSSAALMLINDNHEKLAKKSID